MFTARFKNKLHTLSLKECPKLKTEHIQSLMSLKSIARLYLAGSDTSDDKTVHKALVANHSKWTTLDTRKSSKYQ